MPPDRYPPSYSDTPGACPQARHKPLSSPTAVPRVRSCPCRITLHLSAKSPFHGPEAIQRTTSTASRCKRNSAALRTAGSGLVPLPGVPGDESLMSSRPSLLREVPSRPPEDVWVLPVYSTCSICVMMSVPSMKVYRVRFNRVRYILMSGSVCQGSDCIGCVLYPALRFTFP